jgi:hypothetical protein
MASMIQNKDGRWELFAIDVDKALLHKWTDITGTWTDWASLEGSHKQIAVAANKSGTLEVFSIGESNELFHRWQLTPGGAWNAEGWVSLGGSHKQIEVAANKSGALEVFAIGESNTTAPS